MKNTTNLDNRTLVLITGLALFSMFFGAGNLILPPYLGWQSGHNWIVVAIGFLISAVCIPLLGILGHAKLRGTMIDFALPVSKNFAVFYCICIYTISITLPSPRTAAVTHELAVAPFFTVPSWITSLIYFSGVFGIAIFRSQLLSVLGKYLTPILVGICLLIIGLALVDSSITSTNHTFETVFSGILEGYQTFDAIGAIVVGGVLIISLQKVQQLPYSLVQPLLSKAGLLAGLLLFIMYLGLIYTGSQIGPSLPSDSTRTQVLLYLNTYFLGSTGAKVLAICMTLACFSTAIGIVTGTADFVCGLFPRHKEMMYRSTVGVGCLLGIGIGQIDVHSILDLAIPMLAALYPLTITLIFLALLPNQIRTPLLYRSSCIIVLLFSSLHVFEALGYSLSSYITDSLPLSEYQMSWVLPTTLVLILLSTFELLKNRT